MVKFVLTRIGSMIVVLLVLAFVILCLQRYTPADPVRAKLGANASKESVARERHRLGYDKPLPVQYLNYVRGLLHGDMQDSLRTRHPVLDDLRAYLPATLELALFSLVLAIVMGMSLGLAAAARARGSGLLRIVLVAGASAPTFLVALIGLLVFYRRLGWLPSTGRTSFYDAPDGPTGLLTIDSLLAGRLDVFWDVLQHLVMPGFCVAIGPAVAIGRTLRGSVVATLRTDYVRTARSKGLRERTVLLKHAVRNSMGPALSMTGLQVGLMFAGVVVVESIFAWPGLGLYTVQSIPRLDFPAIAGVTLLLGALYVVVNAVVDVVQAIVDPRLTL